MAKRADFSAEVERISTDVEKDVGTIIKLVREEEAAKTQWLGKNLDAMSKPSPDLAEQTHAPAKQRRKIVFDEQIVLENVTTRLSHDTNELLTEAALRQRLKKEEPATRQDIIEEALHNWFKKQGYR